MQTRPSRDATSLPTARMQPVIEHSTKGARRRDDGNSPLSQCSAHRSWPTLSPLKWCQTKTAEGTSAMVPMLPEACHFAPMRQYVNITIDSLRSNGNRFKVAPNWKRLSYQWTLSLAGSEQCANELQANRITYLACDTFQTISASSHCRFERICARVVNMNGINQ